MPTDGANIAIKAARLLAAQDRVPGGAHIEIEKHVPVTGGMGGGSADAAATLLACDALWGTELPREEMLDLARKLGADVPFAFTGGTAIRNRNHCHYRSRCHYRSHYQSHRHHHRRRRFQWTLL